MNSQLFWGTVLITCYVAFLCVPSQWWPLCTKHEVEAFSSAQDRSAATAGMSLPRCQDEISGDVAAQKPEGGGKFYPFLIYNQVEVDLKSIRSCFV